MLSWRWAHGISPPLLPHTLLFLCKALSSVSSCFQKLTGGVFVSREPNKIILYRGYGRYEALPSFEGLEDVELRPDFGISLLRKGLQDAGVEFEADGDSEEGSVGDEGEGWEDEFGDEEDPSEELISAEIDDVLELDSGVEEGEELDSFLKELVEDTDEENDDESLRVDLNDWRS